MNLQNWLKVKVNVHDIAIKL